MSSEIAITDMDDDRAVPAGGDFGEEYITWNEWFGDFVGGPRWVYFPALYRNTDRERGILSKSDRRFLLDNYTLDLSDTVQRNSRTRLRNRVVSAYFDAQLLQFISDRDRELIFKNVGSDSDGLDFREAFKELVRFSALGLLEDDTEIDVAAILEQGLREAKEQHARRKGENASFEVETAVTRTDGASIETLERRYTSHAHLTIDELAVLVQSPHINNDGSTISADEIDLVDAIYYDARQPSTGSTRRSHSRDRQEAERIVEWLREFLAEYDVETRDELEEIVARMKELDEDRCDDLLDKLDRLLAVAPHFEEQLVDQSKLSERDTILLNDIVCNPENIDVETALKNTVRPPLAGEEWDPTEDDDLQQFIARVEVARESGAVLPLGDDSRDRWERVRDLANFDEQEWADYMEEQRIECCRTHLENRLEEEGIDAAAIGQTHSWQQFLESRPDDEQTFQEFGFLYSEEVLEAALASLAGEPELS